MKVIKIVFMLLIVSMIVACAGSAKKAAKWTPNSSFPEVTCDFPSIGARDAFLTELTRKKIPTTLSPDQRHFLSASVEKDGTLLLTKTLQRYVSSISDFTTLSGLDMEFSSKAVNKSIVLTPTRSRSYQVSMVGEWPIPDITPREVVEYLSSQCFV